MLNDFKISKIYSTNPKHTIKIWSDFVSTFKNKRYLVSQDHELIQEFVKPLFKREYIVRNQDVFYRARINNTLPYKKYDSKQNLGTPPGDKANPGRFNPRGISFLYVANDVETAVSEVRPYMSAKIDIAKCKILKQKRLWDITIDGKNSDNGFKALLTKEFSKPINPYRAELEYIPTQYIAEYCRTNGFDGIKYSSVYNSDGYNICLFNSEDVEITYYKSVIVNNIEIKYKESIS